MEAPQVVLVPQLVLLLLQQELRMYPSFLGYISISTYTLLVALLPLAVALLLLARPLLLRLLVLLRGPPPLVPPPAQVLRLVLALNSRTTQLFVHL